MWITFYYRGRFTETSYVGGQSSQLLDYINPEEYGFPDVMGYIKHSPGYTEIGGIYVKGQIGAWELMLDDNDVRKVFSRFTDRDEVEFYLDNTVDRSIEPYPENQPHVTLRPRPNFIEGKILKPKRKFLAL